MCKITGSLFHHNNNNQNLIPLGNIAHWQGEVALLADEELGNGAVVGDEGSDNAEGASGFGDINLP